MTSLIDDEINLFITENCWCNKSIILAVDQMVVGDGVSRTKIFLQTVPNGQGVLGVSKMLAHIISRYEMLLP